ncbi:hypothetical protein SDC9_166590 [bioreactor metagenome]|uniref:Uncharacterized protein n=1 Tax=bioreactor metagenome TaxID=1076179 RepID=A0A645G506_9ZZZZ
MLLQGPNLPFLVLRQHFGDGFLNGKTASNRLGGFLVVPRQHDDLDTHPLQFSDSTGTGGLDSVGHGDNAEYFAFTGKIQGGLPRRCQFFADLGEFFLFHMVIRHIGQIPRNNPFPADRGRHAFAGGGLEIFDRIKRHAVLFGFSDNRGGQRMLGGFFQRGCDFQKLIFRNRTVGYHIGDLRLSFGDGSGFVQHHGIDHMGNLQ